jgi:hypothetical protein
MVELCKLRHDRMMSDINNNTAVHYQPPPTADASKAAPLNMEDMVKQVLKLLMSGETPGKAMEQIMKQYYTFFRLMVIDDDIHLICCVMHHIIIYRDLYLA